MTEKSGAVVDVPTWKTLVVLEFSPKAPDATVEWVLAKIQAPLNRGGAELLVRTVVLQEGKDVIFHINATTERLLDAAEITELKKEYFDGSLREFTVADFQNFKDSEDADDFLSLSEKQRLIMHELQTIRALETDKEIPGYPKLELYHGEALIPKLKKEEVIQKIFPLHDKEVLKRLGFSWYKAVLNPQPLDEIRKYFGETIAMYFAFLGFYTVALIPPAFIGLISAILPNKDMNLQLFFAIFNMIWVTIFLEAWKRRCSTLAYRWGTIGTEQFEEARPEYYGRLATNKITDRLEPRYPKWKRMARYYGVSLPIVLLCLVGAFYIMVFYFWMEEGVMAYHKEKDSVLSYLLLYVPTILYSVAIYILNALYRRLAKILNDWENHRLQSAYNNHLIVKLVSFDFMNCFMCLFYTAFVWQDMRILRNSLAVLLITTQIINQILESVIPFYIYKFRAKKIKKSHTSDLQKKIPGAEPLLDDEVNKQVELESAMDEYEDTLDDYLEMFLQFGYVFLFSAVFPSAAFWALLNNISEIRTDAFKLCRIYQRSFAKPVAHIGAWQTAFEMMGVIAVMTNCALIALSPQVQKYVPEYGATNLLFYFVVAEHLILFAKLALATLIPDEPGWVHIALARLEYQAKQAWRKERRTKAQDAKLLKASEKGKEEENKLA